MMTPSDGTTFARLVGNPAFNYANRSPGVNTWRGGQTHHRMVMNSLADASDSIASNFNGRAFRFRQPLMVSEAIQNKIGNRVWSRGRTPAVASKAYNRFWRPMGMAAKTFAAGLGFDALLGGASVLAAGITESANWYAKTGMEEDYVGGFVYGVNRESAAFAGSMIGAVAGGTIGTLVNPGIGTTVGLIAGSIAGGMFGASMGNAGAYHKGVAVSRMTAGGLASRRVQFGRGFVDSRGAATMRQQAVQEMSGSLMNARQYLGNEAYFMH